jgi:hypothetical protein
VHGTVGETNRMSRASIVTVDDDPMVLRATVLHRDLATI